MSNRIKAIGFKASRPELSVKRLDMWRAFLGLAVGAAFLGSVAKPSTSLASLTYSGPPQLSLDSTTYDEVSALKLKGAKVVWVNKTFFKSEGVDVESTQGFRQISERLKNEFGYLIPTKNTPSSLFDTQEKKFYPDRYGGPGLNGNLGSGRAASFGDFQLKGLGPTSMVGPHADLDHASGGVGATQAIAEAIWSEILNRETPHRSNLVVALIDTGLTEPLANGISQPRYLVVRQDPLRPAHFIANANEMAQEKKQLDERRTDANIERLRELMARYHANGSSAPLNATFPVFTEKVAAQWAYLHANLIHHGAVSPSNIDLSGAMLDLSSVSTLKGAMLAMGHDPKPFGDASVLDLYLLKPFYDAIVAHPKSGLTLPYESLRAHFNKAYDRAYRVEILKLTGLRDAVAEKMIETESGRRVFDRIEMLRKEGYTENIPTKVAVPEKSGDFQASKILALLGSSSAALADGSFSPWAFDALILNKGLRSQIQGEFSTFYREVYESSGINKETLSKEIAAQSAERNRDRSNLRRNFKTYVAKASRAVLSRFAPLDLQRWVDQQIDENTLHVKSDRELSKEIEKKRSHQKALSCPRAFAS